MESQLIMALLFGALGIFLGSMRSRHIFSDLVVLAIWAVIFLLNPTYFMGAAIGGYLVGWGGRCLRERALRSGKKDDDGNTGG
ncbi:hypothetical protein GC174_18325 [bacterium]|nr:hypothetical protein [bacterium]